MTLETWLAFFIAKFLRVPRQLRFINRLFGGLCAAALLATFKRRLGSGARRNLV